MGRTPTSYKLEVAGSIMADSWIRTRGTTGWYSQDYGGGWYMADTTWVRTYNAKSIYSSTGTIRTDGSLQVGNGGATFIATNGGNVGINNASPTYQLDVTGNQRVTGTLIVNTEIWGRGSSYGNYSIYYGLATGESLRLDTFDKDGKWVARGFTLMTNGNIKMGGSVADYKLNVSGVIYASTGIFSDGYVSARGQNTSSDARLKQNFPPFEIELSKIANAPSVGFNWKYGGRDVGSIAQYWQGVNTLLTPKGPAGYLTLQYGKTALLASITIAKAVESVERRVERLERENEELKRKIEILERR